MWIWPAVQRKLSAGRIQHFQANKFDCAWKKLVIDQTDLADEKKLVANTKTWLRANINMYTGHSQQLICHYSWQQGRGLRWRKVRYGWLLYLCCSFSNTFSALLFRWQESVCWKTKRSRLNGPWRCGGRLERRTVWDILSVWLFLLFSSSFLFISIR